MFLARNQEEENIEIERRFKDKQTADKCLIDKRHLAWSLIDFSHSSFPSLITLKIFELLSQRSGLTNID